MISTTRLKEKVFISFVVPVHNEEETIHFFVDSIKNIFHTSAFLYEIIFVNDGSTDDTLNFLLELQKHSSEIYIIDFSRNFGKEAALTAGLRAAKGDVVVPIDVDLQDPPELVLEMIKKWREGYDVVVGKRIDRKSDSWIKRKSAEYFYYINNKISDPKLPENVGDFRLMDRIVVDALNELSESRRFMKGLFSWVGFKTAIIEYVRPNRIAGTTKFNGWRLWNFALEGITSFSITPLKIWFYIGLLIAFFSFLFAFFIVLKVIIYGVDVPGYASVIVAVTFLGGLQLIGIGILGEYLGRSYIESKKRPVYIIRRVFEKKESV